MEALTFEVSNREFNFLIDVLQDIARNEIHGDSVKVGAKAHNRDEADKLCDKLLQQRMGLA